VLNERTLHAILSARNSTTVDVPVLGSVYNIDDRWADFNCPSCSFCRTENRNPNIATAAQPAAAAAKARGGTSRAIAARLAATLHLPPLLQAFVSTVARQQQVGNMAQMRASCGAPATCYMALQQYDAVVLLSPVGNTRHEAFANQMALVLCSRCRTSATSLVLAGRKAAALLPGKQVSRDTRLLHADYATLS
jgi:hypothetical protein